MQYISFRILGTVICLTALWGHKWSEMLFTKAEAWYVEALGDLYPQKLPELTQFTLRFFHSPYWSLGQWVPWGILLGIWTLRPAWIVALLNGLVFLWVTAFLCVVPMSFWMGDEMIVHALKDLAKKAVLEQGKKTK